MGLMATARGRIQKRIVKVVAVTAGLTSGLLPVPDCRVP